MHDRPAAAGGDESWTPIDGKEQVILGDLSILAEGGPVKVAQATEPTKVANDTPAHGHRPAEVRRTDSRPPRTDTCSAGIVQSSGMKTKRHSSNSRICP